MADLFAQIHNLIQEGCSDDALTRLYDRDRQEIRSPFDSDPNHAWYVVGDIFYKQAAFDAALNAFRRACDVRPDDLQALMAAGNCYSDLGLFKEAENYFTLALNNDETNDNVKYNLSCALFDQEKYKECIQHYKTVSGAAGSVYKWARQNIRLAERRIRHAQKSNQRTRGRKPLRHS